ncbi:MAG: phosphatidylserine decarboxylase family protein [Nitrospirota bacterium]
MLSKIAHEGYPFILGTLVTTVILGILLFWTWRSGTQQFVFFLLVALTGISLLAALFMPYFFRDPERVIPRGEGLFVAPADGKVILIKDVYEQEYLGSQTREVSIFMSPLDVHVNRAPCDGEVVTVEHKAGKFLAAYKEDAPIKNEHINMVLESKQGKLLVRQVAGFIARRAVCRVKPGDLLRRGERYGMIKFSSRLDVYLPQDVQITVKSGDTVKAGETVIAKTKSYHQ